MNRLRRQAGPAVGVGGYRVRGRAEQELLAAFGEAHLLNPEAVDREQSLPRPAVDDGERKRAAKVLEQVVAPGGIGFRHGFPVAVRRRDRR